MVIALVLFLALVVGTVYRIMIAINTDSGSVVDNAYNSGKNYAKVLENRRKIIDAGWSMIIETPNEVISKTNQSYKISTMKDDNNKIVKSVRVYFYRPSDKTEDFNKDATMVDGGYEFEIELKLKGKWIMVGEANTEDGVLSKAVTLMAK